MKRLLGTFATLFALILLGVVAACVLASSVYTWCRATIQAYWPRLHPIHKGAAELRPAQSLLNARRHVTG